MDDIQEGDVFRWEFKTTKEREPYWTKDQQCVAVKDCNQLKLVDTYWHRVWDIDTIGSQAFILNLDEVTLLSKVCNMNKVKKINELDLDKYDTVYNLSYQHNCYKCYCVDVDAEFSPSKIKESYFRKLVSLHEKKQYIEREIIELNKLISEL